MRPPFARVVRMGNSSKHHAVSISVSIVNKYDKWLIGCLVAASFLIASMDSYLFDAGSWLHAVFGSGKGERVLGFLVLDMWHIAKNLLLIVSYSLLPYFARRGELNERWYLLGAIAVGILFTLTYHVILGAPF